MSNTPFFRLGDRVMYSSAFCQAINASRGWIPAARGVVVERWTYGKDQMVSVLWDDDHTPRSLLANNLIRIHEEPIDSHLIDQEDYLPAWA